MGKGLRGKWGGAKEGGGVANDESQSACIYLIIRYSFTDSYTKAGAGRGGGVNILKLRDIKMYKMVHFMTAWAL